MIVKRDSMGHAIPDTKTYLASKGMHPTTTTPTSNLLQQREQIQREVWEQERKTLLKKASNSQGESTERILATYLAI